MRPRDILDILDGVPTANLDLIAITIEAAREDFTIDPRGFDGDPARTQAAAAQAQQYVRATHRLTENIRWTFDRH